MITTATMQKNFGRLQRFLGSAFAAAVALFAFVQSAHAAGNFFIDGGNIGGPSGPSFAGLANISNSCFYARELFKVFDTASPQDGANVIDCYEGSDVITLTDGQVVTKPIILYGSAKVAIADGATVTFQTSSPIAPFIYVGANAQIDLQPATTATFKSETSLPGNEYFITLRGGAVSTFKNVIFDGGGAQPIAVPQCDTAIVADTQDPALQTSIVNVHKDHSATAQPVFENVTFRNAAMNSLYVAQPATLTNVHFENAALGIVRDLRTNASTTVAATGVDYTNLSISNTARIEIVGAQNATGSLAADESVLLCDAAAPAFSATPQLTVQTQPAENADGTVTDAVVRVALTDGSGAPVTNTTGADLTFDITFTDGSATGAAATGSGADFNNTAQQVSIASGASFADITVPVFTDALLEADETFAVVAEPNAAAVTAGIASGQQTVQVTLSDATTAQATLTATDGAEGDSSTPVNFTVTLDKANATGAPVQFTVAFSGTATPGDDYTDTATGTVTIADGAQTATITLPVLDDAVYEGDETVIATLSNPSDTSVTIGTAAATATITDNDFPALTASVAVTQNGDEETPTDIIYTVTLSGENHTGAPITFDTAFTGGTATATDDYGASVAGSKTITIVPGARSGVLTVPVVNDAALESDETVALTISNPSHASVTIATAQAVATISDDEARRVAAENGTRDKGRESKPSKKKKKHRVATAIATVAQAPVERIARAVEPILQEKTESIPVAKTVEHVRPGQDDNTLVWTRNAQAQAPKVLGAETANDHNGSGAQWRWIVPLIILLLAIIVVVTYYVLQRARARRQEAAMAQDPETWWEKRR